MAAVRRGLGAEVAILTDANTAYSLADARLWHLAFAWAFAALIAGYLLWGLLSGHLRRRIAPRLAELAPASLKLADDRTLAQLLADCPFIGLERISA